MKHRATLQENIIHISYKFLPLAMAIAISLAFSNDALADYFNCFQAGNCPSPALSMSQICLPCRDYEITLTDTNSDVTVLSYHGGNIESHTSGISKDLQERYPWNRYDLNGHGTPTCLEGDSQFARLHITSSKFNDPDAVFLVGSHPKSVAIHGYGSHRGYPDGRICVGGKNKPQIDAFINHVNTHEDDFPDYDLEPVDATDDPGKSLCQGLSGISLQNLVNCNSQGEGLQLELSPKMRDDLDDCDLLNCDALRDLIYGAVEAAMKE